jgi:hypothetical protein
MRNAYNILAGKPEGKRPLGKLCSRWEDINIKINLREIGLAMWIGFILLRIGTSEHYNEPSGSMALIHRVKFQSAGDLTPCDLRPCGSGLGSFVFYTS